MIEAYFFDLDGTLVDTEILWVEALERFAQEQGYELSHEAAVAMVYGQAWPEVYELFQKRFSERTWSMQDMADHLSRHFLRLRNSRDVRIKGSIALLRALSLSCPVAVVSGSYREDVKAAIDIMDIASSVRFYLGHEDYHPGKPHPACYLEAAKRLNVDPLRCVVFEDSQAGISAAKRAGMFCVALARQGRPAQDCSSADLVLEDLEFFRPT